MLRSKARRLWAIAPWWPGRESFHYFIWILFAIFHAQSRFCEKSWSNWIDILPTGFIYRLDIFSQLFSRMTWHFRFLEVSEMSSNSSIIQVLIYLLCGLCLAGVRQISGPHLGCLGISEYADGVKSPLDHMSVSLVLNPFLGSNNVES